MHACVNVGYSIKNLTIDQSCRSQCPTRILHFPRLTKPRYESPMSL